MSEFRDGDRVRVEFEGTLSGGTTSDGRYRVLADGSSLRVGDAEFAWVKPESLTKLAPALPTKEGSVIESHGHRFMLTRGGWHAASDSEAAWTNAELQDSMYAENFTVVLEG